MEHYGNEPKHISEILHTLAETYPDLRCELKHQNPFELLVGTILAAQATDKKVNEVTAELFKKYKKPEDFAGLTQEVLEQEIKSINLYRNKAKYIIHMSQALITHHKGEVPKTRDELVKLSGVGRKTANVVLSYAFGIPAIAVDTHVHRVANRLGITKTKQVPKTELEMERIIPKEWWSKAHSSMVLHGRRVCDAKKPKCGICPLTSYCDYYHQIINDKAKEGEHGSERE